MDLKCIILANFTILLMPSALEHYYSRHRPPAERYQKLPPAQRLKGNELQTEGTVLAITNCRIKLPDY